MGEAAVELVVPASPNDGATLTYDEAALYESISRREVFRRARDGRYRIVPGLGLARNGKPQNKIILSSLSAGGQAAYLKMHAAGVASAEVGTSAPTGPNRSLVASKTTATAEGGCATPAKTTTSCGSDLPALPEPARGAAIPLTPEGRPDIVALRLAGRNSEIEVYDRRIMAVAECQAALAAAGHGDRMKTWQRLEIELETPQQTLRGWIARVQKHGHIGLFPGWGHNRGETSMPEWMQQAILARWLNQMRPRLSQVMDTLRELCRRHHHPVPSRGTVARFIQRNTTAMENTTFRQGKRAYDEFCMAKVTRDPNSLRPNEMWCADHRRMDTFVIAPDGRIVRPWLTLFIDIASGSFAGWCLRDRPSAQSVALALRHGIMRRGVPRELYYDNGKEFTAQRFGGKPRTRLQLQEPAQADYDACERWPAAFPPSVDSAGGWSTLRALGIERIHNALPYSSWSKPIEPICGAFAKRFENLLPGWCGHNVDSKPEKLVREMKEHRLLTWEQYVEVFTEQVRLWESEHICGDRKLTPDVAYAAAGVVLTADEAALDLLLVHPQPRKVTTQGIEIGPVKFLNDKLMIYVGEWVDMLYDPDNLAAICVRPKRNPNVRIVVQAIPTAEWTRMNAANEAVWSARKAQRGALIARAQMTRAALSPEHQDPTGANAMAVGNAAAFRAQIEAAHADAPKHPDSAAAAIRQAEKDDQVDTAARDEARRRSATAAAQSILAQAAAVQADRAGVAQPPPAVTA